VEGWRGGGVEGWRGGGVEGWRGEGWRGGGVEGWRGGRVEGWRGGGWRGEGVDRWGGGVEVEEWVALNIKVTPSVKKIRSPGKTESTACCKFGLKRRERILLFLP
jgi:hypothetical protein